MLSLRIFISSPGGVQLERQIARRVVAELQAEFAGKASIERYFWEYEPMRLTGDSQGQIRPLRGAAGRASAQAHLRPHAARRRRDAAAGARHLDRLAGITNLGGMVPGEPVLLTVWRQGTALKLTVVVGQRPPDTP